MACTHRKQRWIAPRTFECRDCGATVRSEAIPKSAFARRMRSVQLPDLEIAKQKGWKRGSTRRTVEGAVDEAWASGKRTHKQLEAAARAEACGATSPARYAYLTACGARRIQQLRKKARAERTVTWTDKGPTT